MIRNIEYIIIMYSNRTDTMRLHQCLNRLGVKNSIVPTPNQLSSSCGLSIKALYKNINKIIYCINKYTLTQNFKIYSEQKLMNKTIYSKIN